MWFIVGYSGYDSSGIVVVNIDDIHPLLTPLATVVPTQLISYYAALQSDFDIDKPRNLVKSVTVE